MNRRLAPPPAHPTRLIRPIRLTCRAAAAALLIPLVAAPAPGQEGTRARPFTGTAQVTAVELLVTVEDGAGRLPEDLVPGDFEVLEDGEPVPVIGVEVWRRGTVVRQAAGTVTETQVTEESLWTWHSLIYFDQVLSSSRSIRRSAEGLAAQAGRLTQLGTVEIVTANPAVEQVLAPTRSGPLVEQTLERLAREAVGRDELRRIRRQLVHDQQVLGVRSVRESQISVLIAQEFDLLRRQHDVLMARVGGELHDGPRALLLVNDGYDLRPQDFYDQFVGGHMEGGGLTSRGIQSAGGVAALNAEANTQASATDVEHLGKTLAASGWVTFNMALGALEAAATVGAEMTGRGRSGDIDLRAKVDFNAAGVDNVVVRPLDPGRQLAVATGGDVLTGVNALPRTLETLADKVRLTYQVTRVPDGELHRVEVRARRPGLKVSAPRWSGSTAPEGTAAARARQLLAGGADRGDLEVAAAVALEPAGEPAAPAAETSAEAAPARPQRGKLQARIDLRPLRDSYGPAQVTPVRITVAASFAEGEPFVYHDLVDSQNLAGLDAWTYALPIRLPGEMERLSVVFEDLTTGAWGGAVAAVVEGELPAAVAAAGASDAAGSAAIPEDLLPDRKAIVLLPIEEPVVRGRVLIEPVVAGPRVAQVDYRLDGRLVETAQKPPFAARVDFGEMPAPRLIEVVALDAAGVELGRDGYTVNEGVGPFRVRIIEPRSGERVGAVDVEAEVKVPGGPTQLERVEVLWNGERVATLYEPPYRARVYVPPDAPVGYIAVQAHHVIGDVAEDLVFLNGTGSAERVDVKLIELFTVVEDPAERPVRGLGRADFAVFEDGDEQDLADFREGAEMPLALGLVMDTSASMTPSLRAAQAAAIDFTLLALSREEDRAFVVAFDARPELVQPLTAERDALVDAIAGLRPGGVSALCDALVFSLVQMQRIPGRRALVVITDGVGREERVDFGTCQRFVQRSGIPVYAILLAGDDPTAARHGGIDAETLGRLTGSVGGRLFVADRLDRLGGVYRAVIEELRSQYLLTYYPRRAAAGPDEGWREVEVDVARPGLVARTLAGYYP